jgi:hypothetical protein
MPDETDRERILARITRQAGVTDLVEVLAQRLAPSDLHSLLLEVARRQSATVSPAELLSSYRQNRFVTPSSASPARLAQLDLLAWSLLPAECAVLELSPVCPLGTVSSIATVDQDKVLTTIHGTEVVADSTNVLALECALRRRHLLNAHPKNADRVRLAASHRLLRTQRFAPPDSQHFRLIGLCTAGRDEGDFRFETESLVEHISFFLRLLQAAPSVGPSISGVRLTLTDLCDGRREQLLAERVASPLAARFPDIPWAFDRDRAHGRGYYRDVGYQIFLSDRDAGETFVVDGGFTDFTQRLLSSSKERLLASGMGTERLCRP